ncbi:MAG TPA: hypothetical protein VFH72_13140 [Candidatus Baltobacteraceae bacterium]|nr:hypothetical protein [Candidatus Baltobacteraceae bacterium]
MSNMRVASAFCAALALSACAHAPTPGSTAAVLNALSSALDVQYHACVPLGWNPVVVAGTYYPGYIASRQSYEETWDAIWRGRILTAETAKLPVKPVYEVLNHLVEAGLLKRTRSSSSYDYYLKYAALPYYYDTSWFGNNKGDMQYLCYSKIVPDRILWVEHTRRPSDWSGPAQWYRASFTWKASAPAAWARDPFLRAHSVILAPLKSPTTAKMFYIDKTWHVVNIYDRTWMMPKVARSSL